MGCGGSKSEAESKVDGEQKQLQRKVELNETSWEEYLSVEKDIMMYQRRHVVEMLKVRCEQKKQLEDNAKRMEDELKKINKEISKSRNGQNGVAGSPGTGSEHLVKRFLMKQEKYDELAAYEKADHLAMLNRQEILKKELTGTKQHIVELTHECELLQEDVDELKELRASQDQLLDAWFDGEYGSRLENDLEDELEWLEVQMQKYEECNFKWRQAQVMVEYACKQIGTAVEKWQEIIKLPISSMEARYHLAEETRNNLIAAGQNLQGAHRYLPHIKFPYCTPEEVVMLNKATSYVFTDMQAKARLTHALDCYTAAHKRSGALLQWCNQTINTVIRKHLMDVKEKTKKVRRELRRERANLIVKLIKDKFGKTVEVPTADIEYDGESGLDYDLMSEDDRNRKASGNSVTMRGSYSELDYSSVSYAPSPLPIEELASLPSKVQLFGPIDEQEYDRQKKHKNGPTSIQSHGPDAKWKSGQRRNSHRLNTEHDSHQQNGPHKINNSNTNRHQSSHMPNQVTDVEDDEDFRVTGHPAVKNVAKDIKRY